MNEYSIVLFNSENGLSSKPTIRTRPLGTILLKHIPYRSLVSKRVVPKWDNYINNDFRSYPNWLHKTIKPVMGQQATYCYFGLLMELFVRRAISQVANVNWGSGDPVEAQNPNTSWSHLCCLFFGQVQKISPSFFVGPWWDSIEFFTKQIFSNFTDIRYNVELSYEFNDFVWTGHPDIMGSGWIIDVKTATKFKTHTPQAWIQILSYACLARLQNIVINQVGILLPLQQQIIMIDISQWDHRPFAELVNNVVSKFLKEKISSVIHQQTISTQISQACQGVGYTIGKNHDSKSLNLDQALTVALDRYGYNLPFQIFLRSRLCRKTQKDMDPIILRSTAQLIYNFGLSVYVHGPYNINPASLKGDGEEDISYDSCCNSNDGPSSSNISNFNSNSNGNSNNSYSSSSNSSNNIPNFNSSSNISSGYNGNSNSNSNGNSNGGSNGNSNTGCHGGSNTIPSTYWGIEKIQSELTIANALGCKGVVMHVGKATECESDIAFKQQLYFISQCLPAASEYCPLLLETPIGAGKELCANIKDMAATYVAFCGDPRFGICIDTCHAWAAGYDPAEYITHWLQYYPAKSIGLVHFNDAQNDKNSRKDGHARPGTGKIPIDSLVKVNNICRKNNIPMVFE